MSYAVHERMHPVWRYEVDDETNSAQIDIYRSRAVAESACYLLNAGVATVDPHAIVGCRVGMAR